MKLIATVALVKYFGINECFLLLKQEGEADKKTDLIEFYAQEFKRSFKERYKDNVHETTQIHNCAYVYANVLQRLCEPHNTPCFRCG
jgi:hypothetical protein